MTHHHHHHGHHNPQNPQHLMSDDTEYGEDVHKLIDQIPVPTEDSNSSMNNSPIELRSTSRHQTSRSISQTTPVSHTTYSVENSTTERGEGLPSSNRPPRNLTPGGMYSGGMETDMADATPPERRRVPLMRGLGTLEGSQELPHNLWGHGDMGGMGGMGGMGNINIHNMNIPNMNIPNMNIPNMNIPNIHNIPNMNIPNIHNIHNIQESDASYVSNNMESLTPKQLDKIENWTQHHTTVGDQSIFPHVQATSIHIPSDTLVLTPGSPNININIPPNRAHNPQHMECEETLNLSASPDTLNTNRQSGTDWIFTPKVLGTDSATGTTGYKSHDIMNPSPEFKTNSESPAARTRLISNQSKEEAKVNLGSQMEKHYEEGINIGDVENMENMQNIPLNHEFHKMKFDISQFRIKLGEVLEENGSLREIIEMKGGEVRELQKDNSELNNDVMDMKEHIGLLEQQSKDGKKNIKSSYIDTRLPSLRGKLLENARIEINQLRIYLDMRDKKINDLEFRLEQNELQQNTQSKVTVNIYIYIYI